MPQKKIWVTTVDNPYDPWTQWNKWYRFDEKAGYHTCARLASMAAASNELSDAEYEDCIDSAINRLLSWYDPYEVYRLAIEGEGIPFGSVEE